MTIERIIRAVVAVVFCICVMMARPVAASEIVGITSGVFASGFKCCATLYSIDPLTGNATLLRNKVRSYSFGASGSPDAGTIFVESGFKL